MNLNENVKEQISQSSSRTMGTFSRKRCQGQVEYCQAQLKPLLTSSQIRRQSLTYDEYQKENEQNATQESIKQLTRQIKTLQKKLQEYEEKEKQKEKEKEAKKAAKKEKKTAKKEREKQEREQREKYERDKWQFERDQWQFERDQWIEEERRRKRSKCLIF